MNDIYEIVDPEQLQDYEEFVDRMATEAVRNTSSFIKNNNMDEDFKTYFIPTIETVISAMKLASDDNPAMEYFPLTTSFVSGLLFAIIHEDQAIDILNELLESRMVAAKGLEDLEIRCYNMIHDYLDVKDKIEELPIDLTN